MATVSAQRIDTPLDIQSLQLFVWRDLHGGDLAAPHRVAGGQMTVQWVQPLGRPFGGSTGIEGSLDPDPLTARYSTVNDTNGNTLAGLREPRIEMILEPVYFIRPIVGAGLDGVDVWLLLRR